MISKENAEHYVWGDSCDGWYLLNRQDMLIIHEKMPPGTCEKRHYHCLSRQFFFVLQGFLPWSWRGRGTRSALSRGWKFPRVRAPGEKR